MDKLHSFLLEWAVNYIKNKDLLTGNLEDIELGKDGFDFIATFKDKKQYFIIKPFIENIVEIINRINKEDYFGLVVFNTKENFRAMVDNWDILVEFKNLGIYFVNPFSQLDKRWIIYPHIHHKISEASSLETGLKTMFEVVESTTKEELEEKIKGRT
jgi:hypothetical protein